MFFILPPVCSADRGRINNIAKQANFGVNGAIEMEYGSVDGGDDTLISISFVEISKISATRGDFSYVVAPFNGV